MTSYTLHCGDCLEVLRTISDGSLDACVTDPPYGLSFMGKAWDYDVPSVEIWQQVFRVLKPGGHLLAFAGTRTQHRMAVAIEDAGFEIRDMIAWVYGSGFPKSLDVSKAIDKTAPRRGLFDAFAQHFDDMWRISGLKRAEFVPYFPHYKNAESVMAQLSNWKLAKNVPTKQDFLILQDLLGLSDEFAPLIDRIESEREVVGPTQRGAQAVSTGRYGAWGDGITPTAPATPAAQQWAGWGTALKPALEPITVARKPFKGTVAACVLQHGTGAINVDGCRVEGAPPSVPQPVFNSPTGRTYGMKTGEGRNGEMSQAAGRWPANLIHDGSDDVVKLFPQSQGMARTVLKRGATTGTSIGGKDRYGTAAPHEAEAGYGDSGSAARFFYSAKASASERQGVAHPTVKPIDLMAYLCRLVTPPGGIVLDPFMGSGTTIKAAIGEGFKGIGIERDPAYFAMAEHRMDGSQIGIPLVNC